MDVERKPWLPIQAVGRLLFNQPRRLAVVVLPDGSVSMYGPGKTVADVLAEHPPGHCVSSADDQVLDSAKHLRPGSIYYLKPSAPISCVTWNAADISREQAECTAYTRHDDDGLLNANLATTSAGKSRQQSVPVRRSMSLASGLSSTGGAGGSGGSGSGGSRANSSSSCSSNSSTHSAAAVSDPWGRLDPRRKRGGSGRRNSMAAAAGGGGGGNGAGSSGASAGGRRSSSSGMRRMSLSLDDLPELDAPALPHLLRAHVPRSQSMCDRREGSSAAPAADDKSSAHAAGRGGSGSGGGGVWDRIRRRRASFSVGSPSGELGSEKPHRAPWSAVAEEAEEEEGAAPVSVAAAGDDKGWLRDLVGAGRNWRGMRIGGGKDRQTSASPAENGSERGWLRGKMGSAKGRRASLSLGNLREMREMREIQEGGEGDRGDSSCVDGVKQETGDEWRERSSSFDHRNPWTADHTHKVTIPTSLTHVSVSPHVWSAEGEQTDDGACANPGSIASQARRPVTPRTPLAPPDLAQHAGGSADGLTAERNGADPWGWRGGTVGNGQAPGFGCGRAAFPRNASVDSGQHMGEGKWEGLAHACLFPGGGRVAHWPEETSLEGGTRQVGLSGSGTVQEGMHLGWGSGRGGEGGCEERNVQQEQQQEQQRVPQQQRHRRSSSFNPQEREVLFSSLWDCPPPRTPPARSHTPEWGQLQPPQGPTGRGMQHAPQLLPVHMMPKGSHVQDSRQHEDKVQQAQLYQQFDRYMPYGVQQRQQQQQQQQQWQQVSLPQMTPSSHALSQSPAAVGSHGVDPRYPDIMG